MTENIEISKLSIEIREKTKFSPTTESIKQFDQKLNKTNIKEFIIYNFLNQNGTWLRELVLSTFKYWKELNYKDWKYIFSKIDKNVLGEYYMNAISKTYLGIDPKFKSSKGFRERIFPKKYRQTEKSYKFVEYSESDFLGFSHKELEKDFMSLSSLIKYSDKLLKEMNDSYLSVE